MRVDAVEIRRSPGELIGGFLIAVMLVVCVAGTATSSQYLGTMFYLVLGLGAWLVLRQGDKKDVRNGNYWLRADEFGLQGHLIDQAVNGTRRAEKVVVPWANVTRAKVAQMESFGLVFRRPGRCRVTLAVLAPRRAPSRDAETRRPN